LGVEVWDFTPVVYGVQPPVPDPIEFSGLRRFSTMRDAETSVRALTPDAFVVCIPRYRTDTVWIYKALSRAPVPYATFEAIATPPAGRPGAYGLWRRISALGLTALARRALFTLAYPRSSIRSATFVLAGGERSVNAAAVARRAREILWLHTLDYDLYLRRPEAAPSGEDTGVFLDELYPFHPDYGLMGARPPVTADEYYPMLDAFFRDLERRRGVRIVVAAHPRSSPDHLKYFAPRTVLLGQTCECVRTSRFVIAHSSTSINFAVLYRKPVLFVTCDRLRRWLLGASIDNTAAALGKTPINLDRRTPIDVERELRVDERAYRAYTNAYIKRDGTPDRPFWAQVADRVEGLP